MMVAYKIRSMPKPTRITIPSLLRGLAYKIRHPSKEEFECPICSYSGPFLDITPSTGKRLHAKCPQCGALERHRLQYLVMAKLMNTIEAGKMRMLHFAPEDFFRGQFASTFGDYQTADLSMPGVDHHVDIQSLPFASGSYDIIYASHVLEHISDDQTAISEIRRVLAPGGVAVLPVPIICAETVEYPEPNPHESMHVRAPGLDYYNRYRALFSRVELYASDSFPERHQLFTYEDRSFIDPQVSSRTPMVGSKHQDVVPVCYA